jgi:hypothetical protein
MLRDQRPRPSKPVRKMPDNPKPKLKLTTLAVFRVHHLDLESYIQTVFGFEFDFQIATGAGVGICPEYLVTGSLSTSEWQRRAQELRNGRRTRDVVLILNTLAHDGYIPKGRYTVNTKPLPPPITVYTELLQRTRDPQSAECVQMKADFAADPVFTERAATLDKVWYARKAEAA